MDLLGQTTYIGGALQGASSSVSLPSEATSGKTFKTYTITDTKYTDPAGKFGTNYVIEVAGNNSGEDRFIAMALSDVDNNNHTWWNWFYDNSSSLGTSYDIGKGKSNTETVKALWDGNTSGQNTDSSYTDIWSLVTLNGDSADWFIPSNNEWIAFGAMNWTDNADTRVTRSITGGSSGNYSSSFGLSDCYWSSLQDSSFTDCAQYTNFSLGCMDTDVLAIFYRVRLSTTF